jgi:signal transduction histidine kinase
MSSARKRLRPRALRARLTLWYASILTASLVVFGGLVYARLSYSLYRHHDAALAREADRLVGLAAEASASPADLARFLDLATDAGAQFVMVRDETGRLLRAAGLPGGPDDDSGAHEAFVHAAAATAVTGPQFFFAGLADGTPVRFICRPLAGPPRLYLQVGQMLGDVQLPLQTLAWTLVALVPLIVLASGLGGFTLAGRALRPIDDVGSALQAIHATDLGRRVRLDSGDEELSRLVRAINQLLDRLQQAFATVRRFAADASHQLQTPLTVIKGSLEVTLGAPRDSASYQRVLADLAGEVDDLSAVVGDLRALSLADIPVSEGARERVDASSAFGEAAELVTALGEASGVTVEVEIEPDLRIWGDRVRLKQVLLNLGENAVKFSGAGGRVAIAARTEDRSLVLKVTDNGPGIDADHLPHVFERFYRVPAHRHVAGTGLGLAVVKGIVDAHAGDVVVESEPGQGARFTVRLPLAR